MANRHFISITLLLSLSFLLQDAMAQGQAKDSPEVIKNLIISYDINASADTKKTVLADVYDGGTKTIFIQNNQARVRLVSLMRIESIYFLPGTDTSKFACRVKESGKDKYKHTIGLSEWNAMNAKYDGDSCELFTDSLMILDYKCRKAVIHLKGDDKQITVYYTDSLKPVSKKIEPAFAGIPGLVLQYSYEFKSGVITYTAGSISFEKADPKIFVLPAKGFKEWKE